MRGVVNSMFKAAAALVFAGSVLAMAPTNSYASGFIGDTVDATLNVGLSPLNFFSTSPPSTLPQSAVVTDPGVEYVSNAGLLKFNITAADIGGKVLLISFLNPTLKATVTPAMHFLFTNMDYQPGPVPILSVVNDAGIVPTALSHTANSISINFGSLHLAPGGSNFSHFTVSALTVPEPATYLLLGSLGVIALLATRYRRKHACA